MMESQAIDLHVHSKASDGTCTPTELIALAKEAHLKAIALTDHDTIDGLDEARNAARDAGIEFVPGIELSTSYEEKELHVVGLYFNEQDSALTSELTKFVQSRDERNLEMIENLKKEGFDITAEKIQKMFPDCVMTRAHFARYLYEKGYIKSIKEAFDKYLGDRCRCFVDREKISTPDAISLIKQAGGIAILAHPVLYHYSDARLSNVLDILKEAGLDGIEAIYSTNEPSDERNLKKMAAEKGLLISGGTDFHGSNKPKISLGSGFGKLYVPYEVLERLKALPHMASKNS